MALLTPQQIAVTGTAPSYAAVSSSDTISPDANDNLFLHVKNAGGSPDTVAIADISISVPATTGDRMIAVPAAAMDPVTGLINVTHSFTTSVTQALLRR
jgi:hypothetical protein